MKSWIVTARVKSLRQYVIEAETAEEARELEGRITQDMELDMLDWDVTDVEPNE